MAWGGRIIEGKRNTAGNRPRSRGGEFLPTRSIVVPWNAPRESQPFLLWATVIFGLAWAAVGVLSGHMSIAVFHFGGRAALCVSAALFALATAVSIQGMHASGGDDQEVWAWWMRTLGWIALVCMLSACAIELGEWRGLLPDTDGSIGLLSTDALRDLLASPRLARWLEPHHDTLQRCAGVSIGACVVWTLLRRLWARKEPSPGEPGSFLSLVLITPAAVCGTLLGIALLASGGDSPHSYDSEDDYRAALAFTQSLTLLGLLFCCYLFVALRQAVYRAIGR